MSNKKKYNWNDRFLTHNECNKNQLLTLEIRSTPHFNFSLTKVGLSRPYEPLIIQWEFQNYFGLYICISF